MGKSKSSMYMAPIVLMIAMWVILFIPAGTIKFWEGWILWSGFSLITLFRIKNEEVMLLRDLNEYKDYCLKTPYRLIPLIW